MGPKTAATVCAILLTSGFLARAEDKVGPPAAECKKVASRLLKETGAKLDRWTPSGYRVFFKNPEMLFDCDVDYPINRGLLLSWGGPEFPSDGWIKSVAVAARVVTGDEITNLESSTRKCYRDALNNENKLAALDLPNGMAVLCSNLWMKPGAETVRFYKND